MPEGGNIPPERLNSDERLLDQLAAALERVEEIRAALAANLAERKDA